MKFIQLTSGALTWICVGTVALQATAVTMMWTGGYLSASKVNQIFAIGYGVDPHSIHEELAAKPDSEDSEQSPFESTIVARSMNRLDLDLREMAIDNAMANLNYFQKSLKSEKQRYDNTRQQFEDRHKVHRDAATDEALLQVQQTLMALSPRQAKDQIQRYISDDAAKEGERAMNDLVTIVKSMPLDKRKKILAEFKTDAEQRQLGDILQRIRLGVPNIDLIRKTRDQLRQFQPQSGGGSKDGFNSV